ncbi:MAG: alpha/beta hydrolase [Beijerinckiaceae bacterium]|nr:alpha/beta hydrolase [Beijerinckiaceae bacterium]
MEFQNFELEFDKDGNLFHPDTLARAIDGLKAGQLTDVFVFSHGWNNDIEDARQLYENYFDRTGDILRSGMVQFLGDRKFAVITIFWPSKKFTDEDLIPGGGAASVEDDKIDQDILRQLDELKKDPIRLGEDQTNPVLAALAEQAKALLPSLRSDEAARAQFVLLLRSMLNPNEAHADDGSSEFFTAAPEQILTALSSPVIVPPEASGGGGAAALGGEGSGYVGDLLGGIKAGVRRLLNFSTYYKMKERAGTVGRVGLAPVLRQIRQELPRLRIHLIGHSFGGRVVTAASHALDDSTAVQTMTLLQAAYSHNGFARKFDGEHDGAFRSLLTRHRVTGPICITYSHNDKAVGIAYPLASRLSRDQAAALGDANDPYGGMGRNGAQRTPEAEGRSFTLTEAGQSLVLDNGKVHNFESSACIADHGDVANAPVAYLTLAAAAKT